MLLPMAPVGIPNRGNALHPRNILILVVLVLATLAAAATGFADPTPEAIVEPRTPDEPEVVGIGVESTALAPKTEGESVAEVGSSQTPALVELMTEVGRSWTYVYVRERTRSLAGGEPKVEKSHGTRVDEITGLAPEFGEGVVRVQSRSHGRAASSPSDSTEEHAGFYRVSDSSYQLVAEQIYDPTSGVAALVRYDVPLSLLEAGAQPGQRWRVGVRSQGDLHTDLEGEVLGVQDVQTPHGLFERCLVIRLTGQISGVVEAYGSRMEVPSGDFSVTRWYAPGIGLVLAKEEFSQILVLEDGTQMDYSERTQFALRSTKSPGAAAPASGEP